MSDFMKSLSRIAIPVTLQSMLQASFSIIDQIMIGQLGEVNIAAVGLYGNFSLVFSVVIGAQHYTPEQQQTDSLRTEFFAQNHIRVLRFTNLDIDRRFDGVCQTIEAAVQAAV